MSVLPVEQDLSKSSPENPLVSSSNSGTSPSTPVYNATTFSLNPRMFRSVDCQLQVIVYRSSALTPSIIKSFTDTIVDGAIGISFAIGDKLRLTRIAFGSATHVLVVLCGKNWDEMKVLQKMLGDFTTIKYALRTDQLVLSLYLDHRLRLNQGVDMLWLSERSRDSPQAMIDALGDGAIIYNKAFYSVFVDYEGEPSVKFLAIQAWSCYYASTLSYMKPKLAVCPRIHADALNNQVLLVLAMSMHHSNLLASLCPEWKENEVESALQIGKSGNAELLSTRFKTRVADLAGHQALAVNITKAGKESTILLPSARVTGKAAEVHLDSSWHGSTVNSVVTLGKEKGTQAENLRRQIVFMILRRASNLHEHPFFRWIYLGKPEAGSFLDSAQSKPIPIIYPPSHLLNDSQQKAVESILSMREDQRLVIIRGPPGSGKTICIASAVVSYMLSASPPCVWLVARSNVAVKNMAEKLVSIGFLDFKILVSTTFHLDWHEHLYDKVQFHLIKSEELDVGDFQTERLLQGSKVILCTLSMLSTSRISSIARLVPPQVMLVDEASQIETGDYLPVLHLFQNSLEKLVFIGDNMQLAPHGQDEISALHSVFEEKHLIKKMLMLNIQYRMPVPIGDFISQRVYNSKLHSAHVVNSFECCCFIDVNQGREEWRGHSKVNEQEVKVVIGLAHKLQASGRSFRILTPYDAQRGVIEQGLKAEGLAWEDRCFNIDAFQGNEDDYIIVSIVASDKLGFLKDRRRINVMLTRCKVKMIICSSRDFLEKVAPKSLVAKLAAHIGEEAWIDWRQVLYGDFQP
ncbi:hypothetical protein VKT23_006878 [Stygiomarasmius scandens]|uniref:DNA2/NAM7 helicase-like C-terminal domain-containing protein n=1 Tax=Marasmiellus scandens TaxID=2682957 RepID=A0ABR1JM38_9AGAR